MKIIIFSGTTEGRTLSEMLSGIELKHTVCVASEYGQVVMNPNDCADVRVGRLDRDAMAELFKDAGENVLVVDATHPYAVEVTANIREAASMTGAEYIRVIRDSSGAEGFIYDSTETAAEAIGAILSDSNGGNVLLTTGSKELNVICDRLTAEQKHRLYVRVLPSVDSLNICLDNGIEPGHIIAMQGPFSNDMNRAIYEQYDIKHLLTKESGAAGGFEDKIRAAEQSGVTCHVITRKAEEGLHVEEAVSYIAEKVDIKIDNIPHISLEKSEKSGKNEVNITIAGIGMGTAGTMTAEVCERIRQADALFGASRLIRNIDCPRKYDMYRAEDIIPVIEQDRSIRNAVIVFSGDSGFYSGAAKMLEKLKEKGYSVDIMCGISSVSYFAAKLGKPYSDACVYSLHGRNELVNINRIILNILYNRRTYVLLSGAEDVRAIGRGLAAHKAEQCTVYVGINLSYDSETIIKMTPDEAARFDKEGIMAAFIENESCEAKPLVKVLRDDAFIRDRVPMTKEYVRHASILELNLKQNDTVYDIGGGTGSVAIEIAGMDPSLKVYTIEKKPEAIELIEKNKALHNADNLAVIRGEAPGALAMLEPCNAAFIGGSGNNLEEILEAIRYRSPGARIVINAVSVETISEINALIKKFDVEDVRGVSLAVTDIREVGSYHMMQANNPVMIYSFILK